MTEEQSLWKRINTESTEMHDKLDFEINIIRRVKFKDDFKEPKERVGDNGLYCIFDVLDEKNEQKVIISSAITLLVGLKKLEPLAGKTVSITKKIEKGKQFFVVEEVSPGKNPAPQSPPNMPFIVETSHQ